MATINGGFHYLMANHVTCCGRLTTVATDLALRKLIFVVLKDGLPRFGLSILTRGSKSRVIAPVDEDAPLRLIARNVQPAAPAHRVVFIDARPGEFNAR